MGGLRGLEGDARRGAAKDVLRLTLDGLGSFDDLRVGRVAEACMPCMLAFRPRLDQSSAAQAPIFQRVFGRWRPWRAGRQLGGPTPPTLTWSGTSSARLDLQARSVPP